MKQTEPKRWRIAGTSDDGLKVTLGRYETKEEADRDLTRYETAGFYKKITLIPIKVEEPPEENTDATDGQKGKS